ncbi:MAG: hypothetical protein JXQ67_00780 [Campylobacterales bacterium]|nr:hypothetical protein [Campylobacterales bacterium]
MRNSFIALLLFVSLLLQGCGGENSYDGENGLLSSGGSDVSEPLASIYVLIQEDANTTLLLAQELDALVDDANNSLADFEALREKTEELILSYKRVEALYVAEKLESAMTDIPVYVEAFSAGDIDRKTPILNELASILAPTNTTPIESALYKNAYKSITGLVYLLYEDQQSSATLFAKMDTRRVDAAKLMTQSIVTQLGIIESFYESDSSFLDDASISITILLNQLAISSNRLKEWRVGDPGGLTQKYLANPDEERFEYWASKSSLEAMQAILQAHKAVLENGLYTIAQAGGATSEADAIETKIDELLALVGSFTSPIEESVSDAKVTQLYNGAYQLQVSYTALINALNFQQDIIEADGD